MLKAARTATGLSQTQLARRTGYSRSMISTVESAGGSWASRDFWRQCDQALGTGGTLTARFEEIPREPTGPRTHARRDEPGSEPKGGYSGLGWPVEEQEDGPELVTGHVVDALEVSRAAGIMAARWWQYTGGVADEVRGLPALPPLEEALAVIEAGPVLFFLVAAGHCPWAPAYGTGPGPAGETEGPLIRWHAAGSRIPAPPLPAGADGRARWAHFPTGRVRLASPIALLDLLAKAAATTRRDRDALVLPGGVLAVPAVGPRPVVSRQRMASPGSG